MGGEGEKGEGPVDVTERLSRRAVRSGDVKGGKSSDLSKGNREVVPCEEEGGEGEKGGGGAAGARGRGGGEEL